VAVSGCSGPIKNEGSGTACIAHLLVDLEGLLEQRRGAGILMHRPVEAGEAIETSDSFRVLQTQDLFSDKKRLLSKLFGLRDLVVNGSVFTRLRTLFLATGDKPECKRLLENHLQPLCTLCLCGEVFHE
jgi:hypothetical protein